MRPSPTTRGFRSVMLSLSAHDALTKLPGKPSAALLGLTSRVEQLEAYIAEMRGEMQNLRDELAEQQAKQQAPFDVEAAITFCRMAGTKPAQLLREYLGQ